MLQTSQLFLTIRPFQNHHWVVTLTLVILFLLVIIKWNKNNYFFAFLNSIVSSLFYSKKFAEKRRIEVSEVLLFISSLLGLSLFLLVVVYPEKFSVLNYFQILFLASIILLSKYLIEKIVGELFEFDQLMGKYLFYKQGVLSWIGLFFLFPMALVFYFQDVESTILTLGCLGISALIYIVKLFAFVFSHQKHILSYWFYFILYLCAFEIAPYLILFKVVKIN